MRPVRSFSMCSNHRTPTWMLMLPLLSGVLCNPWNVRYRKNVCAVKGSSVVLPCMFYFPNEDTVQKVMWGHNISDDVKGPFALYNGSEDPSSKFQYIGDKSQNCTIKINQVEHNDTGVYKFRFITTSDKWIGKEGSALKVVDLKTVGTHESGRGVIMEGDAVNVTCVNSCDNGSVSFAFNWFKDKEPVHEGPSLYWSNISPSHSGNYTCSLKGHKKTTSEVVTINVEYGPKTASVLVQPSIKDDPCSNVTLTCSSCANPPVDKYIWFKVHDDDDDDIIRVGNESELLLSGISPATCGHYFCSATNRHGSQNSTVVTLKVQGPFPYTYIFIMAAAISALLIMVTVVFAIRGIYQKRQRAPEADHEDDLQTTVHNIDSSSSSNEGNRCVREKLEVIYATVDFSKRRETKMRQHVDPPHGDVIYSMISAWSEP